METQVDLLMYPDTNLHIFGEQWWEPSQSLPEEWYTADLNTILQRPLSAPATPGAATPDYLSASGWQYADINHFDASASMPSMVNTAPESTWTSSSASPSPELVNATPAAHASRKQTGKKSQTQSSTTEDDTEDSKGLLRRAQNRAAQQAHRERKKKLIEELWMEIHGLRLENGQLQKQLQAKTEMLRSLCQRFNIGEEFLSVQR